MNMNYYNNLGIGVIALGAVLNHCNELPLSKLCIVFPFFSHQEMLQYLARKTTQIKSLEKLIAEKTSYFSNFNKRFYDSLCLTFNALQYLNDVGYVKIKDNSVILFEPLKYDKLMGKRAETIYKAANNVAQLLKDRADKLYLNLRIEL